MNKNILKEIISRRLLDIEERKRRVSVEALKERLSKRKYLSLKEALLKSEIPIIAEIKKASPSAGILRKRYKPEVIARSYEKHGASAISVLTEPNYFQGSITHLERIRASVKIPILCKDFICNEYQIIEAGAYGADAILLIASVLNQNKLQEFYSLATALRLEVIIEVHSKEELFDILEFKEAIIGVNNRNLKTLDTDISTSLTLAPFLPTERVKISESGIHHSEEILKLLKAGYNGFLIGESLLKTKNPGKKLQNLIMSCLRNNWKIS